MSTVRTQDKRHWVQVELQQQDGGMQIDLNMVDEVRFLREEDGSIGMMQVVYAGVLKPYQFEGSSARVLYEAWMNYVTLHAEENRRPRSVIQIPDSNSIRIK